MLSTILVGGVVFAGATDSHHMSLLTQCINGMVLESQLHLKIINLLFTTSKEDIKVDSFVGELTF